MGLGDIWNRTLVYFGIADEYEDWDEDGFMTEEELERTYTRRSQTNVRRLPQRSREDEYEDWTDPEPEPAPSRIRPTLVRQTDRTSAPATTRTRPRAVESRGSSSGSSASVHLVVPRSFNDAQQIADRFKNGVPVIVNLQSTDQELSKRLIDFTSGLTYALNGGMQRVADKVFLLTPRDVEVSAEERARIFEKGGFFNQA